MWKLTRTMLLGAALIVAVGLVFTALTAPHAYSQDGAAAEPAPPAGQTYTGSKRCASCHFEQYISWKKTKHSSAFTDLTSKYQSNAECLKCHTTGYGEATGYKSSADTGLAGVTCEQCHGPGSEHEKVAQGFGKKKLTEAEEKQVRDTIWAVLPKNVCIECHEVQSHKKSSTPPELQKK